MPYYEYECQECGRVMEVFQHMDESPFKTHKWIEADNDHDCDGILERKVSIPSLQFVGPGFYVNDYKK
jgi:putative FmdB family regulatory protein